MGVHCDGGLRETLYVPTHKLHPVDMSKIPGGKPTGKLPSCDSLPRAHRGPSMRGPRSRTPRARPTGFDTSLHCLLTERRGWGAVALVETLCIGCHAVNRAEVKPDEWVLIVGAGTRGTPSKLATTPAAPWQPRGKG